ncbi:unnamed protein product [Clonostachys rosea]|uniref:Cerato-platanin n=1 Tax=Bionectria ochroleuca TaxID=29856 RepID=A0ABY6TRQ1_BIOOC|nr:unnamed protein product [Clonostachys rosea]
MQIHNIMYLLVALLLHIHAVHSLPASSSDTQTVWATPHDSYSSSVGVLGCKVNTNRIAYWPQSIDCDNICISLSYEGRTVKLLRIDQSQGAYDVSYDAWNYLYTGKSATDAPAAGGAVEMQTKNLKASECKDLIKTKGNVLPLSAANSMNYLASCLSSDTWVGNNYRLYNIADSVCSLGKDESCELDWPTANQAKCPSTLGDTSKLDSAPVYNIRYPTGQTVLASTNEIVESGSSATLTLLSGSRNMIMLLAWSALLSYWICSS